LTENNAIIFYCTKALAAKLPKVSPKPLTDINYVNMNPQQKQIQIPGRIHYGWVIVATDSLP
jgi:hypothetical protein